MVLASKETPILSLVINIATNTLLNSMHILLGHLEIPEKHALGIPGTNTLHDPNEDGYNCCALLVLKINPEIIVDIQA